MELYGMSRLAVTRAATLAFVLVACKSDPMDVTSSGPSTDTGDGAESSTGGPSTGGPSTGGPSTGASSGSPETTTASSTGGASTGDTSTGDTGGSSGLLVAGTAIEIPNVFYPITLNLDGDARDDVAIAMTNALAAIAGAAPTQPFYHPLPGAQSQILAASDIDGDGDSDVVSAQVDTLYASMKTVRRTADGFADVATADLAPCFGPLGLAVADIDGDDIADAVVGCGLLPGVMIARGVGDGVFADPMLLPLDSYPAGLLLADVLGSPALDLITFDQQNHKLLVHAGTGTTFEFAPGQTFAAMQPFDLATGDLDGDGVPDYLLHHGLTGACQTFFGSGEGLVPGPEASCGVYPIDVHIGDFDGDGLGDVASIDFVNGLPGALNTFRGRGDGSFDPPTVYPTGFNTWHAALGDYNGDTRLDAVVISDNLVTFFLQAP